MSDEYVKDEEIVETSWTCPTCSTRNRGRDMKCASCGAPKDESARYEVDEHAQAVTDEVQLEDAAAGEHWVCAYCDKQNRGRVRVRVCRFCGSDQRRGPKAQQDSVPAPQPPGGRWKRRLLVAGAVVAAILVLLVWPGSPRRTQGRVAALEWEQLLVLHVKTKTHREAWHEDVPAGAFDRRCSPRHRSDRRVVDHYVPVSRTREVKYQSGSHEECRTETKDQGNGYAKRQRICRDVPDYDYRAEHYVEQEAVYRTEPVYEDFCAFEAWEWPASRTARRTGSGTSGLAWPDGAELGSPGCRPCGEVRDGPEGQACCDSEAHYRVIFHDENKPDRRLAPYEARDASEFATFSPGQVLPLSVEGDRPTIVREAGK